MRLAIIGAGINGIMSGWALLEEGHDVVMFEQADPMGATSSASTKLLHGGLRYLEHGDFALVREGLRARAWWLERAPQHTRSIEIAIPVYRDSARSRLTLKAGLVAYEFLAGRYRLGGHYWLNGTDLLQRVPHLRSNGLRGAYLFQDGQMNDRALGNWALSQIVGMGAEVVSPVYVERIDTDGVVVTSQGKQKFDGVINACGPWAAALLQRSNVSSRHGLDLIRGSHLLVARRHECGFLVESPDDARPCFVLPYEGYTLIGTTEVRQALDEPIECSEQEIAYLSRVYEAFFDDKLEPAGVVSTFAGVRPLVASAEREVSAMTRESAIECQGRILTIFGGKWTTSRELGLRVAIMAHDWN
ncbi:MAG: FAD-dependent oxidoreductase [Betaproteobacteria bacterium]|nr:MAG: FAD-dependent oxidoreductase [Betaproteobacteria bacterium]